MSLPLTTETDPTTFTPDAATCNSATCSDPTFIFSDHLGSTSITTDVEGNLVSETRYDTWGKVRYASGLTPTDYTYTDQYSYMDDPTTAASEGFGLMFYNARWYDPGLGRFAQADTIIPEQTQGTQAWDRYAYTNNNPLRYTDPSGHSIWDSYKQGWANVGSAWSVATHQNATIAQKAGAGLYIGAWVGAHAGLAVGLGMLACAAAGPGCVKAAEAALGIGGACSRYGNCVDTTQKSLPVVQDLVEAGVEIADDAFVAIHPSWADASIEATGLNPDFSTTGEPYTYVTQWGNIKDLTLEQAADGLKVPPEKWTTQPTTLWEVKGGLDHLFEYTGPGLGDIPQWVSAHPLKDLIKHPMR